MRSRAPCVFLTVRNIRRLYDGVRLCRGSMHSVSDFSVFIPASFISIKNGPFRTENASERLNQHQKTIGRRSTLCYNIKYERSVFMLNYFTLNNLRELIQQLLDIACVWALVYYCLKIVKNNSRTIQIFKLSLIHI